MDELNVNPSEGTEEVVTPQETETETTTNESSEVVDTQVDETPVQDAKTNAMYAEMRRKAQAEAKAETQRLIDQEYANMYGETHGIYSKADYDKAVAEAEREQQIVEDAQRQGVSEDYARRLRDLEDANKSTLSQKEEYERQLNLIKEDSNLKADETFGDYYLENEADIKQRAEEYRVDLTTAMLLSIKDNFRAIKEGTAKKVQQETINNMIRNKNTSTGSLVGGNVENSKSVYDMSKSDFRKMQEEVLNGTRKNL